MTTTIPVAFNNSQSPPFQTIVTLDGTSYTAAATWNFAAQRWYLTLTDASSNLVWNGAMVGSPLNYDIPLAPGIFTISTILFREDSGNLEITP
jgi:hypothetical protein